MTNQFNATSFEMKKNLLFGKLGQDLTTKLKANKNDRKYLGPSNDSLAEALHNSASFYA